MLLLPVVGSYLFCICCVCPLDQRVRPFTWAEGRDKRIPGVKAIGQVLSAVISQVGEKNCFMICIDKTILMRLILPEGNTGEGGGGALVEVCLHVFFLLLFILHLVICTFL